MGHINPGPSSNDNKSNKGHLFPRGNDVPNLISVQKKIIGTSKQYLELSNDYAPNPHPPRFPKMAGTTGQQVSICGLEG